jgi:hypothetical protein
MPRPKKIEPTVINRLALVAVHHPETLTHAEIAELGASALTPAATQRKKRRKRRKKRTAAKKASKPAKKRAKFSKGELAIEKKWRASRTKKKATKKKAASSEKVHNDRVRELLN